MSPAQKRYLRLGLLAAALVAIGVIGVRSGLRERLTLDGIRSLTAAAGVRGVLLYVLIFTVGELVHVPGLFFVAAGIAAYGRVVGGPLAFGAAVVSVATSFIFARLVGGKALADNQTPLLRKLLDRIDDKPVRTVVLLRTFFILSSPLNYGLALTSLRFRDYVLGSAIGLFLPIMGATLLFERLIVYLSTR